MRGKDGDTVSQYAVVDGVYVNLNPFKSGNTMLKMQCYDLDASILFCSDLLKNQEQTRCYIPLLRKI